MLTRRSFLGGLGATGMGAAPPMPPAAGERPNVVIILSDDQGWGDVGCYGAEDAQTPHLDALAASGVRLLDFYANAPMCSPTRAALLTGRYPYRCGVPFVVDSRPGKRGLAGDEITIAEILRGQGYRTGLVGKWHLGSHRDSLPNNQGFDDFFGFHAGCVDYYSHRFYWGLGAGLPSFHDLWRNEREIDESGAYATDLITRESVRFLEEQGGGPFFLVVSYNAPHYPMHAPQEYLERFPPDMDPDRRMHLALCAAMDDGIGLIVQTLERKGLRLSVSGGGCKGFQYSLHLEHSVRDDDRIVVQDGITTYLDPTSAVHLKGTRLDYVRNRHGSGFHFFGLDVERTIGCGSPVLLRGCIRNNTRTEGCVLCAQRPLMDIDLNAATEYVDPRQSISHPGLTPLQKCERCCFVICQCDTA